MYGIFTLNGIFSYIYPSDSTIHVGKYTPEN